MPTWTPALVWMEGLEDAIRNHSAIARAAITGSQARPGGADEYSDLDLLLVARDLEAVRDVRAWLPPRMAVLVCAFHLTHYGTVLLETFEKIDFAIFSVDDPPAKWVVHDYRVLKGDSDFAVELAAAAAEARGKGAADRNPDVSIDNVLLLLATAIGRVGRGELLSGHAFLAMAADMVVCLEKRQSGAGKQADLLDPRRRLETTHGELASILHECLFAAPGPGIRTLAGYLSRRHRKSMGEGHVRVLEHLLDRGGRL